MGKGDFIEAEGEVIQALPNAMFKVRLLESGQEILGFLGGRLRVNFITIAVGDRVTCALSPYDLTKGRIIFRNK